MNPDFDWTWLVLAVPVAFALGWVASRLDLRQWRRESRENPRAYYKGLNLLLNEQQDKAIDAFIEAVQSDPETAELHFALGNLFRRRGEFERAVRVHQHLLQRADLPAADRARAQHAVAQDYMKAGLFDRAEAAFRALEGTPFESQSHMALLTLYERARDWPQAIEIANRLERSGAGSFATRKAHYWCELAEAADAQGKAAEGDEAIDQALSCGAPTARPLVLQGRRCAAAGRHEQALVSWLEVMKQHPAAAPLVAKDAATSARKTGQDPQTLLALQTIQQHRPNHDVATAIGMLLREDASSRADRLTQQLAMAPTLTSASAVLRDVPLAAWSDATRALMTHAVERAAVPMQRYRCAACGFEAQHYFWQCPGCLGWDSFPPIRIEES